MTQRRIAFVTGGAGFIGSNIVAKLAEDRDLDVVVCDRLREAELGKWRNIAKHPIGDFVAPEDMFAWLEKNRVGLSAIYHMGAISSTVERDVDLILQTNVILSMRLWQWCATNKIRFIYASSAATYGDGAQGFEDNGELSYLNTLQPLNAYGWSKHLFDRYVASELAAGRAIPPQWAGLKFFNVYGPNEYHKGWQKSVATQFAPAAIKGEAVKLFKSLRPEYPDGGQQRDFIYVKDCADVMTWLYENPQVSGLFNVGTGQARNFAELAQALFSAAGTKPNIEYVDMPAALAPQYQYFTESSMGRLRLSWVPRVRA